MMAFDKIKQSKCVLISREKYIFFSSLGVFYTIYSADANLDAIFG